MHGGTLINAINAGELFLLLHFADWLEAIAEDIAEGVRWLFHHQKRPAVSRWSMAPAGNLYWQIQPRRHRPDLPHTIPGAGIDCVWCATYSEAYVLAAGRLIV